MNPNQASVTAENNATLRAHESMRPDSERLCYDPYAVYFLPDRIFSAVDRSDQIKWDVAAWESRFPGVGNAIIARTRFIDDRLEAAIDEGIRQLVILGAGYDTRALRCEALADAVTVFEIDHPTTQNRKLERLRKYVDVDLPHVRYIPMDFDTDDLSEKLLRSGFDGRLKTLFIWEGVTYYLAAAAVDRTLAAIHRRSVPQSQVIFDYFPPSVADGTTRLPEARALSEGLSRIGEAILFGIEPDRIDAYMYTRGFSVTHNLTLADYKNIYFKGPNTNRDVSDMFIFVQAMVS